VKIGLIGLGWYGAPLAAHLKSLGHEVSGTTRNPAKKVHFEAMGIKIGTPEELLENEVLIYNFPPSAGPFRLKSKAWPIFVSSTSGSQVQDENWIKENYERWTILRFGGLIGHGRHPGLSMKGKTNLPGRLWPVNLLHRDDAIGVTVAVLERGIQNELITVVSDEHHSREEFYGAYATFDPNDDSIKPAQDNSRVKEFYEFKWSTMLGKEL